MFLSENSLYNTQAEYTTLITDKQKVATMFYINLLGFLGLLKINDKAGAMVTYLAQEKKLRPTTIADDNNDMSLVVKLALDAGIIRRSVAVQITKLLVLIKTKKVRGQDLDEAAIRDIIRECRIQTNRPAQRVYNAVMEFVDNKANIQQTAAALHRISKLPENQDTTSEFRDMITRGGYIGSLLKVSSPVASTATPSTPPAVAATQTRTGRTVTASMPPNGAQTGSDADYQAALAHMFKINTVGPGYLKRFGFVPTFDIERFKTTVVKPEFVLPDNPRHPDPTNHPFARWVRRRDQAAYDVFVKAMKDKKSGVSSTVVPTAAAVAAQAKSTAPKPSVVIPTVTEPVLTQAVAQELNDQTTAASLSATLKKHGWSAQMFTGPDMVPHRKIVELVRGVYLSEYLTAIESDTYIDTVPSTPFIRWARRHLPVTTRSDLPSARNSGFYMLMQTAKHIAFELKDFKKWLRFQKHFFPRLEDWDRKYYGISFRRNTREELSSFNLSDREFIDLLPGIIDEYPATLVTLMTNHHFANDQFMRRLTSVIKTNDIGHLITSVQYAFSEKNKDDRESIVVDYGNSTVSLKKEMVDALSPAEREVFNVVMTNANARTAGTVRVYDGEDSMVHMARIRNLFMNSYMSLSPDDRDFVLEWVKNTDPKTVEDFTPPTNITSTWNRLIQIGVDEDWVWNYVVSRSAVKMSVFAFPNDYIEFLKWVIESNKYKDLSELMFEELIALGFRRNYTMMDAESVIAAIIASNDEKLKNLLYLKPSSVRPHDFLKATNNTLTPEFMRYSLHDPMRVLQSIMSAQGPELAAKYMTEVKKIASLDTILGNKYYSANPNRGTNLLVIGMVVKSAWMYTPDDPDYETAKNTIINSSINLGDIDPKTVKFLSLYNPELLSAVVDESKKKTDSISDAMLVSMLEPGDEADAAIISAAAKMGPIDSSNWEYDSTHLAVLNQIQHASTPVKKAVISAYIDRTETLKSGKVPKQNIDAINRLICETVDSIHETDAKFADEMFAKMRVSTRNMFVRIHGEQTYFDLIKDELYKYPIKPAMQLDRDRIKTILKYNNLNMKFTTKRSVVKRIEDIAKSVEKGVSAVGELNVIETNMTEEDHDKMTLDIASLANGKHGSFAMKVLKTYDVEFPGAKDRIEAFKKSKPGTETLPRVFHGTGTVAASMILRNGFVIIPGNDSSAVGRALGNGIYFSNVTNKAAQYVSDGGFGRRYGTRGYLFEMEAALGQPRVDYRSAGFSGSTESRLSFVSPEWAVFDPHNQLRIYRVHYIELVNEREIDKLKEKYDAKS